MTETPDKITPATGRGDTSAAGEGISDDDMTREVAEQTASDLDAQDVFEREADGAKSETEAAKAPGDELR